MDDKANIHVKTILARKCKVSLKKLSDWENPAASVNLAQKRKLEDDLPASNVKDESVQNKPVNDAKYAGDAGNDNEESPESQVGISASTFYTKKRRLLSGEINNFGSSVNILEGSEKVDETKTADAQTAETSCAGSLKESPIGICIPKKRRLLVMRRKQVLGTEDFENKIKQGDKRNTPNKERQLGCPTKEVRIVYPEDVCYNRKKRLLLKPGLCIERIGNSVTKKVEVKGGDDSASADSMPEKAPTCGYDMAKKCDKSSKGPVTEENKSPVHKRLRSRYLSESGETDETTDLESCREKPCSKKQSVQKCWKAHTIVSAYKKSSRSLSAEKEESRRGRKSSDGAFGSVVEDTGLVAMKEGEQDAENGQTDRITPGYDSNTSRKILVESSKCGKELCFEVPIGSRTSTKISLDKDAKQVHDKLSAEEESETKTALNQQNEVEEGTSKSPPKKGCGSPGHEKMLNVSVTGDTAVTLSSCRSSEGESNDADRGSPLSPRPDSEGSPTIVVHISKDGSISPRSFQVILDSINQNPRPMDTAMEPGNANSMKIPEACQDERSEHACNTNEIDKAEVSGSSSRIVIDNVRSMEESVDSQHKADEKALSSTSVDITGWDENRGQAPKPQQDNIRRSAEIHLPAASTLPCPNQPLVGDYSAIIITPDTAKGKQDDSLASRKSDNGQQLVDAEVCNVREVLMQSSVGGRNVIRHVLMPVAKTKVNAKSTLQEKPPIEIIMPKRIEDGAVLNTGLAMQASSTAERDMINTDLTEGVQQEGRNKKKGKKPKGRNKWIPQMRHFPVLPSGILDGSMQPIPVAVSNSPNVPEDYARAKDKQTLSPTSVVHDICDVNANVAGEYHGGVFLFGAQPIRANKRRIAFGTKDKPRNLQEVICMYIDSLIEENHELLQISHSEFPIIPINWDREVYAQAALQKPTEFPSKKLQMFLEQFNIELQVFPNTELEQQNMNNNATSTILHDVRPWMSDDILSLTSDSIVSNYESKVKELSTASGRRLVSAVTQGALLELYDESMDSDDASETKSRRQSAPGNLIEMSPIMEDGESQNRDQEMDFEEDAEEPNEVDSAVRALLSEHYPRDNFKPFLQELQSPNLPTFAQQLEQLNDKGQGQIHISRVNNAQGLYTHLFQAAQGNVIEMQHTGLPGHGKPDIQNIPNRHQYQEMLQVNAPREGSDSADEEVRSMSAAIALTAIGMGGYRNIGDSTSQNVENFPADISNSNVNNGMHTPDYRGDVYINKVPKRVDQEPDSHLMDLPEEPVPLHLQKNKSSDNEIKSLFDLSDDSADQEVMNTMQNQGHPPAHASNEPQLIIPDIGNKSQLADKDQSGADKTKKPIGHQTNPVVSSSSFSMANSSQVTCHLSSHNPMDATRILCFGDMLFPTDCTPEKSLDPRLTYLPYNFPVNPEKRNATNVTHQSNLSISQQVYSDPRQAPAMMQPLTDGQNLTNVQVCGRAKVNESLAACFLYTGQNQPCSQPNSSLESGNQPQSEAFTQSVGYAASSQAGPLSWMNNQVYSEVQSHGAAEKSASSTSEMRISNQWQTGADAPLGDFEPSSSLKPVLESLQLLYKQPSPEQGASVPWYHRTPEKMRTLAESGPPLTPQSPDLSSIKNLMDVQYKQVYMLDIDARTDESNMDAAKPHQEQLDGGNIRVESIGNDNFSENAHEASNKAHNETMNREPLAAPDANISNTVTDNIAEMMDGLGAGDRSGTKKDGEAERCAEGPSERPHTEKMAGGTAATERSMIEDQESFIKALCLQTLGIDDKPNDKEETRVSSDEKDTIGISGGDKTSPADVPVGKEVSENTSNEWSSCSYDASVSQFHGHLNTSVPDDIFNDPSADTDTNN